MFNRRVIILFLLLGLSLGWLYWSWQFPAARELQAGSQLVSADRWQLDLSGSWEGFASLRKAWTLETENTKGKNAWYSFLNQERPLQLPSTAEISIAARKFRIPTEWSARTMQLVLNGVNGNAQIYLNGSDSGHKVGEFEGVGGTVRITIPATAFHYGSDNILLIQLTGTVQQRSVLFGSEWPSLGQLRGKITLEAVMETSLSIPQTSVTWQGDTAVISIQANLIHHGFLQHGPWQVNAVLSDGSSEIAQASADIQPDESESQPFTLKLSVGNARRWGLQNPFLYQLHLSVMNSTGDRDDLALPLGLRSLSLSGGNVQINGQNIRINGLALTEEQETHIRQTGKISEFLVSQRQKGINLIYFIGQFPDPLWLYAADQVGMGVWVEWPVALFPTRHLPDPAVFQELVGDGKNHPSLWSWTIAKGLDPKGSQTYIREAEQLIHPGLVYILQLNSDGPTGFPVEKSPVINNGVIQGTWGQVTVLPDNTNKPAAWPDKRSVVIWAAIILVLTGINLRLVNWRFKEISEAKPKRRLRHAWFWNGFSVLGRAGTLAAIFTTAIFQIPSGLGSWLPKLWPGLELIQQQNPLMIWTVLGCGITLLRLIQTGLAAPNLTNSPHPWGLTLWLEQRYRWIVIVAGLWALVPWGVSWLASFIAYFGLSILFLPWRIRDIHRVGGRYKPLLIVPGMVFIIFILWGIYHLDDWIYVWHYIVSTGWKFTFPLELFY